MFEKHLPLHINFVDTEQEKRTRRHTYILAAIFAAIVAAVAFVGASASYRAVNNGTNVLSEIKNVPGIADIRHFVSGPGDVKPIPLTNKTRINILLLGIGGDGHDGAQLTDTILLASIDFQNQRAALLSIPRDLAYPLGEGRFEKINAVNAYAEQDHPGEGAARTADAMGKLLEINIDHVVRVDFRGFASFIDTIGGVDVNVERSFTDTQYPTADNGPNPDQWMTVSFSKGLQHMKGDRALQFVRSRHGNNGEGSDFARSRRQQLVTAAVRDKLLSLGTLVNPQKLAALYSVVAKHVQTDLSPWDVINLAPRLASIPWKSVTTRVLTDAPDGQLVAANVNGAYMLFPRKQDWSEIRDITQNPFTTSTEPITTTQPVAQPIRIEVKNGTTRTGFAAQVAAHLEKNGYEVTAFGNAIRRGYEQSVIYDLTGGKKPVELAALRKLLNATVSITSPSQLSKSKDTMRVILGDGLAPETTLSPNSDFLVILGDASYGLVSK